VRIAQLPAPIQRAARFVLPPAFVIAVQVIAFPIPWGLALQGVVIGLLGALVAVGMALVYRSNLVINFAQSQLGLAPTVLAVSLITYSAFNYFLAAAIGLTASLLLGAIVELAVIRRFFRSPRLVLTVATIGLSQLLVAAALFVPAIWNVQPDPVSIHIPINWRFTISPLVFTADHVVAAVVSVVALVTVALMLRFTNVGVAVRASAERSDRAAMLGVPVKRLETIVWVLASVLAFVGTFLQAGILGVEIGVGFDFTVLLAALAAMVLGDLTRLPTIAVTAVALGVLQQGVLWDRINNPDLIDAVFAGIVLVALAVRRVANSRTITGAVSTWTAADTVRPIPGEMRRLLAVRITRAVMLTVVAAAVVALPLLLRSNAGDQLKATAVVLFAMVALSIIVLTGWAGQVSLGQMAFVGFGGATGAYAQQGWHLDAAVALLIGGLTGAVIAVLVGLPALRQRGVFPAVTTLAFSMICSSYLFNPQFFSWLPVNQIAEPKLLGFISLSSEASLFYCSIGVLALTAVGLRAIRRSRTWRTMVALRDNEVGAQSLGVSVIRTKMTAFAISGFIAGVAGYLLVLLLQAFSPTVFGTDQSILVFTDAIVGGLGSMLGAFLGALILQGGQWFLPSQWQILVSGVGILLILMVAPAGVGDLLYRLRDYTLRRHADHLGLSVPGFVSTPRRQSVPPGAVVSDVGHVEDVHGDNSPANLHRLVDEELGQ
jgi:branched-chain amino acid transport system permease protein